MPEHERKSCPRCLSSFTCKTGDIAHCQCNAIRLSDEETAFIEEHYDDCLCIHCLQELKNKYILFREKFLFNG